MIRVGTFLKLAITAAIICLMWDKIDFEQLHFVGTNPMLLAIIPIVWALNMLLTTLRLHTMLRALDRPTQLSDVFHANMASLFVGNLIPGVIGTDVIKFYYLQKSDPSILKTQLALILTLDRVLGLMAVLILCSVFTFFLPIGFNGTSTNITHLLMYMPITLLLIMLSCLALFDFALGFISQFKLPVVIRNFLGIYLQFKQNSSKRLLALVMMYNLLAVSVLLTGLVMVGGQLQLQQSGDPMFSLQLFLVPLVLIASMVPLTPMGIGVAQFTMARAYELFGLASNVGVSISTLSQLGLLSVSILIGGPIFLLGKKGVKRLNECRNSNTTTAHL